MNTPHPDILPPPQKILRHSRRGFLRTISALPIAMSAARLASHATAATAAAGTLPQIRFGPHSMSRLVCGANPFNGGSHLSVFVNKEMKEYYTPAQVLKTLRHCQEVGINFWQSANKNFELYQQFVAEGGRMRYISLGTDPKEISPLLKAGCVAIAHHGEVTDRLFKRGQLDEIHDFLKRVRDAGVMVGVSTHMPAVVDAIESKGWDVDFYMCCVYERHRSAEELQKLLGAVPIPVGEVYLQSDPPRMFKAMRQTKRPCLAFKILAAGRLSERREWVENAFKQTFAGIKPTDGVIVGIYDKFADQPAEDASFTRRFGVSA
ncbi:MAG: hypothetical protein HZA88_01830 [Verrucomicrobia bacterium]|nr:hypothetical protein [Verrucomicrobiota bacterium]